MPHSAARLTSRNRLLAALPRLEYERLRPNMELVHLPKGKVIYEAGDSVRQAYFLTQGMVSLLSTTDEGQTVEVAMVGDEGMVGIPAVLSANPTPYKVQVQIPADAMRLSGASLKEEFDRCGQLQRLLLRFIHMLLTQVSQSAVCNHYHTVEERLCRWLLITCDRVRSDTFHLTQESIAQMLGAPRTSVSEAAGAMQKLGLIGYSRGRILILDRKGLEAAACECYRIITDQIAHLIAA